MLEVQAARLAGQLGQDLPALKPYTSRSCAGRWAIVLGRGAAGTRWAGLGPASCVTRPGTNCGNGSTLNSSLEKQFHEFILLCL